ncbi:MAG: hypothetical protein NT062_23035 [Proteobacteria bacterium]|nr:hypothetical protein [Pseudomonadota bacterium]
MTGAELIRWSRQHEARAGRGWWAGAPMIAVVFGGALAAWVYARMTISTASPITATAASHAWLAGVVAAFGLAFLRVPFLVYWRADAPLLAQLPIAGRVLFDAALARCVRAAATTTAIAVIGAGPLALVDVELALRHLAVAGTLGLAAAALLPAVTVWAASLVDQGILAAVTAMGGAPAKTTPTATPAPAQSSALLGAVPGFAATIVVVIVLLANPWLVRAPIKLSAPGLLAALAAASLAALAAVRARVADRMGTILRDVSALDRQRLATLEILPPTAIERAIARLLGDAALPYRKDAQLVRRRYPMAFALGALAFLVLAIVGLARPAEPEGWLVVTTVGASAYAITLAARLRRPPIELPRVSATLPIEPAAIGRAKLAWLGGWYAIFVLVPGLFATLRLWVF